MTIKEYNALCPKLRDIIKEKARMCEIDLETYLAHTEDNYVISSKRGNLVEWGDYDYNYVVYGSKDEALGDITEDYGDIVLTETMGILLLNSKIMLKSLVN